MKNSNFRKLVGVSLLFIGCTIQLQAQTPQPFVTTWEVADDGNTATTDDLSIAIPTRNGLTYSYTVDWGDRTTDTTTGDATHTYQAAGTYTVAISGDFPAIFFNNDAPQAGDNSLKIKTIKSWGTQRWGTLHSAFQGCQNLTTIEDGAGVPDLTMVTDTRDAFFGATSFNGNLSTWDVSNVTNMRRTFDGATSFNQDISSWNVSNVTNMWRTFNGATSFNQDISSWNVSNVTDMYRTFEGATNFNRDLSSWDVSKVNDIGGMFAGASSFNGNISSWNVSNVTGMAGMFARATSFNGNLSSWNVSNVTSMRWTFLGATNFTGDLSSWNVSNVADMSLMFNDATNFNGDLSTWKVSNVTTMENMFTDATNFSTENYDALLTGWSSLPTLQNGVEFGAPPTTYCAGKAGRDMLTGTYNWNITRDSFSCPFVTTWEVADDGNTATTDDLSITIPINSDFTYAYTVDWGDGTIDATTYTGDATYTYSAAGTYTVSISGDFPAIYFNNDAPEAGDNSLKIKTIKSWGTQRWLSLAGAFRGCQNLTTIEDNAGVPDLTMVTDMGEAFREATSFNSDLNSWDVSNVNDINQTFRGATSFNQDLSSWNVSNVVDIGGTFAQAASFNQDISSWNVSNVTSMAGTFVDASSFSEDLSSWNISKVVDMRWTFNGASSFNGNISNWNVSNVTSMLSTFNAASSFNGDLSSWNISNVTNIEWTFSGASSFNGNISNWNVSNVTSMQSTFSGASSFNQDLSTWNVSNVASMEGTFYGASSFNQDLSSWNVSNVTNMRNTFANASSFNQDLSNWDVPNVTNMVGTFFNATSFNQDLSSWNVSNVTLTAWMFSGATSFNSDLSTWNVSNVTDMNNKFSGATNFNSDLSSWDVSNVFYLTDMLTNATSFSSENYDALLTGWSSLPTLRTGVPFGAPPTTYCAGEAGRNILTSAPHNWVISGDSYQCSPLTLSINAFLQGPYDAASTNIMSDGLRAASSIPTTSPYGDGATIESTVLDVVTGEESNAIVDWVQVSLHDPTDTSVVIVTVPALLQRNGNVVALDGSSALQIQGVAGDYKVSINHRNHIPVITDAAQSLSTTETAIDFTNDLTIVTGGSNAMAEVATGIYALFSGDVNGNNQVQVDDYNAAIQDVGRGGYLDSDVDMNGELQVSDINFVLKTLGKGAQF